MRLRYAWAEETTPGKVHRVGRLDRTPTRGHAGVRPGRGLVTLRYAWAEETRPGNVHRVGRLDRRRLAGTLASVLDEVS